jgi:hypothetical protein
MTDELAIEKEIKISTKIEDGKFVIEFDMPVMKIGLDSDQCLILAKAMWIYWDKIGDDDNGE